MWYGMDEELLEPEENESHKKRSLSKSSHKDPDDSEDSVFNLELSDSPPREKFVRPAAEVKGGDIASLVEDCKSLMREFLQSYKCDCLIPESGKIVVLDTALAVRSAFHALEENNIKSAPLWDSVERDYVGFITVSDFIEILLHFHNETPKINMFQELEKHQIKTWRGGSRATT